MRPAGACGPGRFQPLRRGRRQKSRVRSMSSACEHRIGPSASDDLSTLRRHRRTALAILLVAGVGYSAIAWQAAGAGQDADAWRLLLCGQRLWLTGEYTPSRPPGFPVVELLAALTVPLGLLGFKLLTAWAGAGCVTLTYLLVARRSRRVALWASVLLLCCPAMILASTSTMDYVWSLGFMLLGFWFAQQGRAVACGVLIGLAAGCRLTALGAVPVAWLLLRRDHRASIGRALQLAICATGVTAVLYGWVGWSHPAALLAGGRRFFLPTLDRLWCVPEAFFGHVGSIAVAFAILMAALKTYGHSKPRLRLTPQDRNAIAVLAALFLLAYLVAAWEPFYLLPVLPAFFVLLVSRLHRVATMGLVAALLFTNYRDITPTVVTHGVVVQDSRDRARAVHQARRFLRDPPAPPALVIAGSRAPMLEYLSLSEGPALPEGTRVGYLLRDWMVHEERRPDEHLYCLRETLATCRKKGFDPIALGGRIWPPPAAPTPVPEARQVAQHVDSADAD